jgi:hypothetical protein
MNIPDSGCFPKSPIVGDFNNDHRLNLAFPPSAMAAVVFVLPK